MISALTTSDYDPDFVMSESEPLKELSRTALRCMSLLSNSKAQEAGRFIVHNKVGMHIDRANVYRFQSFLFIVVIVILILLKTAF